MSVGVDSRGKFRKPEGSGGFRCVLVWVPESCGGFRRVPLLAGVGSGGMLRRQVAEASCEGKFRRHVVKHGIRICIYVYTVYIYINIYVCMYVCMYLCMYVCMYAIAVGDTTKAYF